MMPEPTTAASKRPVPTVPATIRRVSPIDDSTSPDPVDLPLNHVPLQRGQRQAEEQRDPAIENRVRLEEGSPDLLRVDLNARRVFPYGGYLNKEARDGASYLFRGQPVVVPPNRFLALGDNSGNSEDSRYWGFVPAMDVVGRPLFIYYPFTSRWGPAK